MSFSKEWIAILDDLAYRFGVAIDWTSENIIPYLQDLCSRFIKYEIFTSIGWIGIMIVIISVCGIIAGIIHKKACADNVDPYNDIVFINIAAKVTMGFLGIIFIAVVGHQIFDIIEALTLPEKTIFEFIKNTLQNKTY